MSTLTLLINLVLVASSSILRLVLLRFQQINLSQKVLLQKLSRPHTIQHANQTYTVNQYCIYWRVLGVKTSNITYIKINHWGCNTGKWLHSSTHSSFRNNHRWFNFTHCIGVRGNICPDSRWRRPRGRPRQTWLHHIADGSPFSIRMEWHRAANRGHGESTRQTSAVYAIWWWWMIQEMSGQIPRSLLIKVVKELLHLLTHLRPA